MNETNQTTPQREKGKIMKPTDEEIKSVAAMLALELVSPITHNVPISTEHCLKIARLHLTLVATKDARIAELEAALKQIAEIPKTINPGLEMTTPNETKWIPREGFNPDEDDFYTHDIYAHTGDPVTKCQVRCSWDNWNILHPSYKWICKIERQLPPPLPQAEEKSEAKLCCLAYKLDSANCPPLRIEVRAITFALEWQKQRAAKQPTKVAGVREIVEKIREFDKDHCSYTRWQTDIEPLLDQLEALDPVKKKGEQ